jgi:hypothetical protein
VFGGRILQSQPPEVDDPFHVIRETSLEEILGAQPVELFKIRAGSHRMDQIIGDIYAFEPLLYGFRIQGVPFDELDSILGTDLDFPGVSDEQPETDGIVDGEFSLEPSSDIARGSG